MVDGGSFHDPYHKESALLPEVDEEGEAIPGHVRRHGEVGRDGGAGGGGSAELGGLRKEQEEQVTQAAEEVFLQTRMISLQEVKKNLGDGVRQ